MDKNKREFTHKFEKLAYTSRYKNIPYAKRAKRPNFLIDFG
jgi:hypothetical protein